MKKKFIAVLMGAVMMMSLAACASGEETQTGGDSGKESGDKIELTFWMMASRQDAFDPMTEAFNAENDDIEVTVSYYDADAIKDACKVAASSDTLPDMWFNWGGSLGNFYTENGKTYDLTKFAEENNWDEKFTPSALSLCTLSDQLSGYPTSYNVIGVYYNKAVFDQCGLEVPTTFEEFENACATLKENGITPISTGGLHGDHLMRFTEQLIENAAGSELHDKMNTFEESWDNESTVKAFEKYKEFVDKGYLPEGFITADPNDALMNLTSGKCAMQFEGQWTDGSLITNGLNPEDFGVFAFPSGDEHRMSAFCEMTQFNANLTEEELAAAVKYMDYCYNKENIDAYGQYLSLPIPTLDAEMPADQPNVKTLIDMSNENGIFTITDQAMPTEVVDVFFSAQEGVATGEMTPEQAAQSIQAAVEAAEN